QNRANIIKTSTFPYDSPPRVTSFAADEGSMQQKLNEFTDLCTRLQRHQTEMASKIAAQDLEITSLKARIKLLEDKDRGVADPSGEDATIKGRSSETREEAGIERSTDKGSNDTEEMVNVLTFLDAASILTSGVQEERERLKRKGIRLEQESAKKVKTSEEVSEEDLKTMMQLVPVKEVYVEALQVKHLIIDREIHTKGLRSYWKIIRLGGSTTSYQFFVDMLKHFDREDLNQLWALVKETLIIRKDTSDKQKELWVELKRLYEPNVEDQLWTQTQTLMHDTVEWRLYDSCGVHHVLSRDQEIFMLVEKEYPLRKGLAIVMISNKLQVEIYCQMANDLIQKIYKIANSIPTASDEFPLSEDFSTASEERFPMLSSGKGEVNTASIPTASTQVSAASVDVATASFSHDTVCTYIGSQSNGSQIKYKDINHIDEDDIEEMDIKWN
nr:hypothetical protein [Tanacetum cinerariifolium]